MILILRIDYHDIYCEKICNYILRIACPEHLMILQHLYWYSIKIKLTNTLTHFEPTFHQNPMSPAIVQLIEQLTTWLYAPQNTEIPQLPLNVEPKWIKLKTKWQSLCSVNFFVAFIIFYLKPTCLKKHLHRRQGQSGFHFLIFILNDEREVQFFIFCGTIAQIFGAKKDMVSAPYLTVFGFLL